MITFHNPLKEDFVFRWDKRPYKIKSGQTVTIDEHLARHGAKHLTDYIILNSNLWEGLKLERENNNLSYGREEIARLILSTEEEPEKKEEPTVLGTEKELKEKEVKKEKKEEEFKDLKNLD